MECRVWMQSEFSQVDQLSVDLTEWIRAQCPKEMSNQLQFNINFVLRELLNNAVEHGNCFCPDKKVTCLLRIDPSGIEIIVQDEGPGFDCDPISDSEGMDWEQKRQRGLWMVEKLGFTVYVEKSRVTAIYDWEGAQ